MALNIRGTGPLNKLKKAIEDMEKRTWGGMQAGANLIKLEAQRLTPVDEGNLKASAYANTVSTSEGPISEIGYTADYAIDQHENLEYNHTVGQAQFLHVAVLLNRQKFLKIVRKYSRIK